MYTVVCAVNTYFKVAVIIDLVDSDNFSMENRGPDWWKERKESYCMPSGVNPYWFPSCYGNGQIFQNY